VEHLGTALRFITDNLQTSVNNYIENESAQRQECLREAVVPVLPGATLMLGCSLLERLVLNLISKNLDSGGKVNPDIPSVGGLSEWQRYLALDANWYGWGELGNFFRLRHCLAHEFGRVTDRQRLYISQFLDDLGNNKVLDRDGNRIRPYYEIVDSELVLIRGKAVDQFRVLLADFFKLLTDHGLEFNK